LGVSAAGTVTLYASWHKFSVQFGSSSYLEVFSFCSTLPTLHPGCSSTLAEHHIRRYTHVDKKWQQYVKKKKQDQICWFGTRHLYSPNNVQQYIKDWIQCTYSYSGDGYVEAWSCGEEMHWEFQLQHGRKSNPADVFMLERPV
jgi:hypothetical protein